MKRLLILLRTAIAVVTELYIYLNQLNFAASQIREQVRRGLDVFFPVQDYGVPVILITMFLRDLFFIYSIIYYYDEILLQSLDLDTLFDRLDRIIDEDDIVDGNLLFTSETTTPELDDIFNWQTMTNEIIQLLFYLNTLFSNIIDIL